MDRNYDVKTIRRSKVSGVVVRPENVKDLTRRVKDLCAKDVVKDQKTELKIALKALDGTEYESDSTGIILKDDYLESRRIAEITIEYRNPDSKRDLRITLMHSKAEIPRNEVVVSSLDETWANGTLMNIDETISNWERQKVWPKKYESLMVIAIVLVLSIFIYSIFEIGSFVLVNKWFDPSDSFALLFIGGLFGFLPAINLSDRIIKLYPNVELIMGPEHAQSERIRRDKLRTIILVVLVPLGIAIIIEIIKIAIG